MLLPGAILTCLAVSLQGAVLVARNTYVMGTVLHASIVAADRAAGIAELERAFRIVRRFDAILSNWRPDAEIARLNGGAAGEPVALPDTLYALLREADGWIAATSGAFDPAIGEGRFVFNDAAHTVARPAAGALFDTGGFAKGAALREVFHDLTSAGVGSALFNFGGQILAIGYAPDGRDWPVPVAHPSRRREPVALLHVHDRSVSTSSQSERPNHIRDPHTGRPVAAWGSVTVVAKDALVADVLSTALFVMGPELGLTWARDRQDVGVLFVVQTQGRVHRRWNRAMKPYLVGG